MVSCAQCCQACARFTGLFLAKILVVSASLFFLVNKGVTNVPFIAWRYLHAVGGGLFPEPSDCNGTQHKQDDPDWLHSRGDNASLQLHANAAHTHFC